MIKLFKPFALLFCAGAIIACSKSELAVEPDPTVINAETGFTYTKGTDPFTFEFKNTSKNFKRLEWRFGDDTLRTSENPTHLYRTTGDFTVELRAISETGAVSRSVQIIKIGPDSIAKITAAKTATANKLAFSLSTKADLAKAEWSVKDDTRPNTPDIKSTALNPELTIPVGRIAPITVKLTTKSGSTATIVKDASTEGIVTDMMNTLLKTTPSRESTNAETSKQLTDKQNSKMFLSWASGNTWQFVMDFNFAQTARFYCIGNGNDSPDRDPKTWTLEGSNNGVDWTVVDSRNLDKHFTQQLLDRGYQNNDADTDWKRFYFPITNPGSYTSYRFNLTANFGSTGMQFGEIILYK